MHPSATCPCIGLCHELEAPEETVDFHAVLIPLGSIWKVSSNHIKYEDRASSQRACIMSYTVE